MNETAVILMDIYLKRILIGLAVCLFSIMLIYYGLKDVEGLKGKFRGELKGNLKGGIKTTTTTLPSGMQQGIYADLCHYLAMFNLTELSWNNVTCEYNASTRHCQCIHVIS